MVLFHEMGQVLLLHLHNNYVCQFLWCGEFKKTNYNMNMTWLRCSAYILYMYTWDNCVTAGNPFSGVKNEFWENKTVKSYFSCLLMMIMIINLYSANSMWFWSHSEGFLSKHVWFYSVTLTSGKSQSPEILLWQGKVGFTKCISSSYHSWSEIEASHMVLEPGKHQCFAILNAFLPVP